MSEREVGVAIRTEFKVLGPEGHAPFLEKDLAELVDDGWELMSVFPVVFPPDRVADQATVAFSALLRRTRVA
jgi:hypothetical protein